MSWVVLALVAAAFACSVVHAAALRRNTLWLTLGVLGATVLLGVGATVVGLMLAFQHAAHVNPADKATTLAASISEAMNSTAFSLAALGFCAPGLIVGEVRRRRRAPQ